MSRAISHAFLIALFLAAPLTGLAATGGYVPGIKIVLEDRTPQGDLRTFQRPGYPPTYWTQDLPVVHGDLLTVNPMIATGGAELGQVKVRRDNTNLAMPAAPPFRVQVNTADLAPGYHMIEVWATTKPPDAKQNSATTTFLVVPQNDSLLRIMQGEGAGAAPAVSDEERLAAAIHSLDPSIEKGIAASSTAEVKAATLFFVAAGAAAKDYFYTLTRDGQLTYTSPKLPLQTHILLEPQKPDGQGLAPGTLILTVRVGDGQGRFGPPAWITVHIKAPEAAK